MTSEVGARGGRKTSRGGISKRQKSKAIFHKLHFEILNDPNIKAKSNWKNKEVKYWTSKLCRKYVKMYHIDIL